MAENPQTLYGPNYSMLSMEWSQCHGMGLNYRPTLFSILVTVVAMGLQHSGMSTPLSGTWLLFLYWFIQAGQRLSHTVRITLRTFQLNYVDEMPWYTL